MANHLEDLVAEWLEFNGYFTRKSVLVGKREKGGFDGELDVVAWHPKSGHLLHVECSLDADTWERREERFTLKFNRGRAHIRKLFEGAQVSETVDQVALMQFGGNDRTNLGGGRLMWVRDFVTVIMDRLATMPPDKKAVPSTYPLLRAMQLGAQPRPKKPRPAALVLVNRTRPFSRRLSCPQGAAARARG